ncbi:MAG TPA: PmoA family protein [Planctomycetaceae bacterium]|nr:PmoA family protein [Planctomycetaceae bacterium]
MRSLLASVSVCGLLLCGACADRRVQGADGRVELTLKGDSLDVTVGGEPFTVYHFAKTQKKPYFWPVRSSGGQVMTRSLEKPKEHPHHKGLWFSVDEVNGIKFWAERGKIENVSVEPIVANGNPARFKVVNHWLGKDGQPILIESTTISIDAKRVIAYDAQLTAAKEPVTFGDTKEGLFGFRLANSMRELQGGKAVNSNGIHGTYECWGKPSDWVDYDGNLEGKLVGVAIFDNPHNFRPSRYHVRDYGLFSISPFGEGAYTKGKKAAAPFVLKPGANLRLRYAIYIHDGDTQAADVAGTYRKYVASSGD